jgi:signal peptidase I
MFVWWGVAFDRLFMNVLGTPRLPKGAPPEIVAGINSCIAKRPPLSETTPPPPAAAAEPAPSSAAR